MSYDPTYVRCPEEASARRQETDRGSRGLGGGAAVSRARDSWWGAEEDLGMGSGDAVPSIANALNAMQWLKGSIPCLFLYCKEINNK